MRSCVYHVYTTDVMSSAQDVLLEHSPASNWISLNNARLLHDVEIAIQIGSGLVLVMAVVFTKCRVVLQ